MEAIQTIGVPRKGASYLAIQKWIASSKENVMINRLKANLKKAIVKALESGLLKRPAISKNVTGLRGYFILNKDAIAQKKKDEVKTAKKLVEKAKATKVAKTKTVAVPDKKAAPASKTKAAAIPKTKAVAAPKPKPAAAPKPKATLALKTKAAAAPKTKAAAIPKTKAVASPKTKAANAQKTKTVATRKTKDVEEIEETSKPKQKSKVSKIKQDDSEAGPSNKPKVKAAVKPRPGKSPVTKSKPKPTAGKHKPEKDEPKEKISRQNGVKFQTEEDLPHLLAKKAASKPTKNMKEGRPRKLYNVDTSIDFSRKDLSDTELNVKPDHRKSLKSYASDTELEVTYNRKKAKVRKVLKKLDVEKETSKTDPSLTIVKKRKGKNSTADDVFE
ncbi:hypothetical protein JTE90_000050 [Oedothorax gibbosus]|uniref:H15 domain-containing protein n=1 Tax=Oedothorax gibbosus TaxID=931172 RepID=A0AAV6UCN2_9ARAC|nr:hypothetical protein JTE90_000050 [Oedothorax gibbosus]